MTARVGSAGGELAATAVGRSRRRSARCVYEWVPLATANAATAATAAASNTAAAAMLYTNASISIAVCIADGVVQ